MTPRYCFFCGHRSSTGHPLIRIDGQDAHVVCAVKHHARVAAADAAYPDAGGYVAVASADGSGVL